MSIAYRMFGGRLRDTSRGGGGYGSSYETGPFLSPTSLDGARDPMGLPAVSEAVGLIAETIASFVFRVYTGPASKRQPVFDAPQAGLLQDGAEDYCTSVDMWSQVVSSIELCENGFLWKGRRKAGGAIVELWPFPAETVCVFVDDRGRKVIEARAGGERTDITADVIHVHGWSPIVSVSGESTVRRHSRTLTGALALEQFKGRYFDSDATPNLLLTHPGSPDKKQREELRDSWNARHAGPSGQKVGILWGGMTAQRLESTLAEAQVTELVNLDAMQVARMFRIFPSWLLLNDPAAALPDVENVTDMLYRLTLLSRIRRIERAVSADRDLFPDRALYCGCDSLNFTRGSVAVAAAKLHQLKQVGAVTANEVRAELGYPPSEDEAADELQATPVGGAPNADQQLSLLNGNGMHAELVNASEEGA